MKSKDPRWVYSFLDDLLRVCDEYSVDPNVVFSDRLKFIKKDNSKYRVIFKDKKKED